MLKTFAICPTKVSEEGTKNLEKRLLLLGIEKNKLTIEGESIEGCLVHNFLLQKFLFFPFRPVELAILSHTVLLDDN